MTISPAHLQVLGNLGYSRRESEFLDLVAVHSGYFTNRQFNSFAQVKPGKPAHEFTSRLVRQKLASFHRYSSRGRVYHLFSRRLYRSIDKDHLRTRRRHELEFIQSRLVALDFVLAHPQYHFLETETSKIAYFQREMNIGLESLPSRRYYGGKSREATTRYFVDGFPLFVSNLSACPTVTFTFVDPGSLSLEFFRTHLRAYAELLRSLGRVAFLYVSPNSRLFQAAESEFYRFVRGLPVGMSSSDLMRYFQVRLAWESNERVLSSDVLFLKGAMARYKKFDSLYEKWRSGAIERNSVERSLEEFEKVPVGTFETCICGSSLSVFSKANGESRERCSGGFCGEISGSGVQTCGTPEAKPKPTVASVRGESRAEKTGARVA